MRRALALAVSVALLAVAPASALVGTGIATLPEPTDVAAHDGVVAWSAPAAAAAGHAIVVRRRGATRNLDVPAQTRPFALHLGPAPGAGSLPQLTYPRCTGEGAQTCRLAVTPLATARERLVPGTTGALRGASSARTSVAAVQRGDGSTRLVVRRDGRSRTLKLPRRLDHSGRTIPAATMKLTDLDLRRDVVGFVLTYPIPGEPQARSEIWRQPIGRSASLVTQIGTGGASSGLREFLGIRLQRSAIVAYRQGRDQGNSVVRVSFRGTALGGVDLGQDLTTDVVSGAYDNGRYLYVTREHTGHSAACEAVAPDGGDLLVPGSCALYDSGPLRLTTARTAPPRPASRARP